ncbi:hypothetical protein R1flu_027393 [Riccia fluitans]|uniref:Uncharacterized protein n=1 Tax=Riccia fluitans TaxID=41844 RepID=A0ABD1XIS8_9MARC
MDDARNIWSSKEANHFVRVLNEQENDFCQNIDFLRSVPTDTRDYSPNPNDFNAQLGENSSLESQLLRQSWSSLQTSEARTGNKNLIQTAKMGRIITERPRDASPRHPSPRAPVPGPPLYLDAKDKDLPYDGCMKRPPLRGPESSYFDQPLGLRAEGAMLLAILTGVQGSPLQKLVPGMPGFSLLYGVGREGAKESPRHTKGTMPSQALKLDLRMGAAAGLNANAEMKKKLQKNISPVDACVDTDDLEELTAEKDPEGASKSWLFGSAEEEELYKYSRDLDARAGAGGKEISLKEYTELVKKSAGRLGLRTQMLQDLCLAEDVDLGVTDLPAAPPPPPPPPAKPGAPGAPAANTERPDDTSKPKVAKDQYVGAMCATSLVVKKARRLAGLMHTEQQTTDLRDIWDWLQHLGTIAPPENRQLDPTAADGSAGANGKPEDQKQGDWRLPSSPALALLYAQEDLRQRLAHLYQEKNTLESRRLQLSAAKKLVGKVGDAEESKLMNYLHGLQTLEEGYETLGGKIADNLNDAENLDKRFQTLTEEARESKSAKGGKGAKKGKKKGKKGKKRRKEEDEEEKDHAGAASGISDAEADAKTESEGSDGEDKTEKKKKKKVKTAKKSPRAAAVPVAPPAPPPVAEHRATSPLSLSSLLHSREVSTMDQACQTDDAALFSLMEKMFNDMEDDAPLEPEDEPTELRRLQKAESAVAFLEISQLD